VARLLGIDYGDRRFGLALTDRSGAVALPLDVVEGEEALWRRLTELLSEEEIQQIVLGLPRNMDGTLGPKAKQVLAFKTRLEARLGLSVETWDERLTTVQAERLLRDGGLSSRDRRRSRVDMVAAQILLQSYIEAQRASPPSELSEDPH
jgi:putative Holliday junction resolvase